MLKCATRDAHLAAERGFQPFLKDPSAHIATFLAAQLCAHETLIEACPDVEPAARDLVDGLARDCLSAGVTRRRLQVARPSLLHPLAVHYLIYGGRQGVAVIRRLLDRTPGLTAPAHFEATPTLDAAWRDTVTALDAVDPASPVARTVLQDVQAGFKIFEQASMACAQPTAEAAT